MLRSLLNTFPSWLVLVSVVGGTVAIGLVAEVLLRRRPRAGDNHEMLTLTFEFVGIAYAILVGFVIVSVWQTQEDAHTAIANEASSLDDMVDLERVIHGSGEGLHDAITAYIEGALRYELGDSLQHGKHDERAEDAADGILDAIVAIAPKDDVSADLRSRLFDSYTEFRDDRTERNSLANQRIAGELWLLVLVSSLAMVLLVAAFTGDGRWDLAATMIVSLTVGLVLYALVALSYPFSGDVSVDPTPLREVGHDIARADR